MPCGSGSSSSISPGALASGRLAGVWIPAHMSTELEVITVPGLPGFDDLIQGSLWNFPGSSVDKDYTCNEGDLGSILRQERSPGEGNGNPLQYSCLGNPTVRGAWWVTVHGVTRVGHAWVTTPPPAPYKALGTMPSSQELQAPALPVPLLYSCIPS